ncbi:lectin subunit alpha-like [Musca autumnalis]|uniref:lectin subunit alpha-like n=1 Tax=Musca autumnalis TaxID=221902 RepID=UPI003CEB7714
MENLKQMLIWTVLIVLVLVELGSAAPETATDGPLPNVEIDYNVKRSEMICCEATTEGPTKNVTRLYHIELYKRVNWFEAYQSCSERNMNLVVLDSSEKTEALTKELEKYFGSNHPNIWIGGHDNQKTGEFVWISSNKLFTYTNWAPRQPDNKSGTEHCALLWNHHNYQWNDGDCSYKMLYVCEKEM